MRAELLQQARIAAKAISVDLLASVSGSVEDLDSAAYQFMKSQLASMRESKPHCRFLYLMGRQADGTVFFFVDSLPPGSEDYAPPGLVYGEVPDSYIPAFETGGESVVGPVTDRWGTLVTALIPIESPDTHRLLAVLGMDVDATDWNQEIMGRCVGPLLVVLLLMLLFVLMASREKILTELKNSEERLRNIVENATNLFYSHSADNVLTYVSPRCREFLQCEPEEAMIQWTEFLTDNPINQKGVELKQQAIDTGTSPKSHEIELIGKKGKVIIVEVNETNVVENGKTIGVVGSLTNITDRKQAEETLRKERDNLKQALEEIKILQGILPICTHCKKIRDGKGYWNQIEAYIREHSEARFSHSVCEECAKKFYPDLDLEDDCPVA
jgi:PAS domain S-box-containing protein